MRNIFVYTSKFKVFKVPWFANSVYSYFLNKFCLYSKSTQDYAKLE